MKRFTSLFAIAASMLAFVILFSAPNVQAQNGQHGNSFIDENGDGYNDNAPDADGDGIPNGQDPDYVAAGAQTGKAANKGFIDADGDGINDNAADDDGDGIPNGQDEDYVRPEAGMGQNAGAGFKGGKGQGQRGAMRFIDEDGDGINDNAPDADGDGVPNGMDEDFVRPENSGRFGQGGGKGAHGFVDEDGDGINDNAPDSDMDGVPNGQDPDWVAPEDCPGAGAQDDGKIKGRFGRGGRGGKN